MIQLIPKPNQKTLRSWAGGRRGLVTQDIRSNISACPPAVFPHEPISGLTMGLPEPLDDVLCEVEAEGTHEGALKGWDTRGRGQKHGTQFTVPHTVGGILEKHGWVKTNEHLARFSHPEHGKLHLRYGHTGVQRFQHWNKEGQVLKVGGRIGKGGVHLEKYLEDLNKPGALVAKPKPVKEKPQPGDTKILPVIEKSLPGGKGRDVSEKQLTSSPVVSQKKLGGGISESHIVILQDGTKAVWKPEAYGFAVDPRREVATWKVADLVGMQDMVSKTAFRTIDGRNGSIAAYAPGTEAAKLQAQGHDVLDGSVDRARAAIFDYVTGQQDRHNGNWVLEGADDVPDDQRKIHLIDHGLAFGGKNNPAALLASSSFIRAVKHNPEGLPSFQDLVKPYVMAKSKILEALKDVGLENRAISGVGIRIDMLANENWETLNRI